MVRVCCHGHQARRAADDRSHGVNLVRDWAPDCDMSCFSLEKITFQRGMKRRYVGMDGDQGDIANRTHPLQDNELLLAGL